MITEKKLRKAYDKAMRVTKPGQDNKIRQMMLTYIFSDKNYENIMRYVDKVEVRNTWIGEKFAFPKIITFVKTKDDFTKLEPNTKYVLKCSAGSGGYKIDLGKNLNWKVFKKFKRKNNWKVNYWKKGEAQYCLGQNLYYIEEYLENINEIKIHTFDNYVIPTVVPNREITAERYAWDGEDMKKRCEYLHGDYKVEKYNNVIDIKMLKDSINLAKEVQKHFQQYVRVDFIVSNGKLYFGEVTFTHNAGWIKFGGNQKMIDKFIKNYKQTNHIDN